MSEMDVFKTLRKADGPGFDTVQLLVLDTEKFKSVSLNSAQVDSITLSENAKAVELTVIASGDAADFVAPVFVSTSVSDSPLYFYPVPKGRWTYALPELPNGVEAQTLKFSSAGFGSGSVLVTVLECV